VTAERAERLAREILNLLGRERDLLLAGRFADLARAAETRDAQLERLQAADAATLAALEAPMAALREAAARNAGLLRAALDGAAAARRRLAALRDAAAPLASYDASGAPVQHGSGPGLARRA
jgi:hypothetical protein